MKDRILKMLKENTGYISGAELGEKLGVSRTAVWKNIAKLKDEGYAIEAVTNKGYRLKPNHDVLNSVEIREKLQDSTFCGEVIFKGETESTNDDLRNAAFAGAKEGTIVVAECQNKGKGRMGRQWNSPTGSGIWLSVLLRPNIEPTLASQLTLVAGLSIAKALRRITGLDIEIKWPNDLLLNGKKICGILTEMSAEIEKINYVIIGIGINVNTKEFPKEIKEIATSLYLESGNFYNRSSMIAEIMNELETGYKKYVTEESFELFAEEYTSVCSTIGSRVDVICKNPFEGTAIGITERGELLVQRNDGTVEEVLSGEVSVRKRK